MPRPIIVNTGDQYGRLTILFESHRTGKEGQRYFACKCSCGKDKLVVASLPNLRSGNTNSCGCLRIERVREACGDTVSPGDRFGYLVVAREVEPRYTSGNRLRMIECVCEYKNCGKTTVVLLNSLRRGNTVSCGCYMREFRSLGLIALKHGDCRRGAKSDEVNIWAGIMTRCYNSKAPHYDDYGGRGILVHLRWHKYENFLEDLLREIGRRPSKRYSLDRKDNNKGYEPGNIKWSTRSQQARNTRRNIWINYEGQDRLLIEVCEELGFPYRAALQRHNRGWATRDLFKSKGYLINGKGYRRTKKENPNANAGTRFTRHYASVGLVVNLGQNSAEKEMVNQNSNAFPITLDSRDLQDPNLSRINRAFAYLWQYLLADQGNGVASDFLNGAGDYTPPATPSYPARHTSTGTPGTLAFDPSGNLYVCIAPDSWVRTGPAGFSNTF